MDAEELAARLGEAGGKGQTVTLCGNSTKVGMGGPVLASELTISTAAMNRVLDYEPRDLTISVEAGISYCELSRVLAEHRQMIPLDPPFSNRATIGGMVAVNSSGPRRRLYGTARDLVIGMTFATLEGKLIKTGGMVVKNVAGLDMGKLMIGSFGTLAAIAVVNFRLHPMPEATRTFVQQFAGAADAIAARDRVLKSVLQPAAIDLMRNADRYQLAIQAGGSTAVLDRYSRELAGATVLEGVDEAALWDGIREFTPRFLREHPEGAVVRVSCALTEVGTVLESMPGPAIARAGSGVCYGYFADAGGAVGRGVMEFAPQNMRESGLLWPDPGSDFAMMKKIKEMFDPRGLLNRGRLYGRL
jgi:glycolate dehydrogenase FAD-binding subunit